MLSIPVSLQTKDNKAEEEKLNKFGIAIKNKELLVSESQNHKFKKRQKAILVGLEDYPQFNGLEVEITNIRENGDYGKAYYIKSKNPELEFQLNWVYEYRLKTK